MPFYIKFTFKLLLLICLGTIITYGQTLLIPLAFAILLSILLLPVTNFLEKRLFFPKSLANMLSVIIAIGIIATIIYFFSHQIASFLQDIPSIKAHLNEHYTTLQHWIQEKFNVSRTQQSVMIKSATADVKSSGTTVIGETVFTITHILFYVILTAIYAFLILFYRHNIKRFLISVFSKDHEPEVVEVLQESKVIVQRYMLGLIIEMGVVAVANCTILLIIGVKYALFLGIFSAILNIIPYVGILTGIVFCCLITLTTSLHLSDIVWIIVGFEIVHFIDSNFLMPRIVGSKVKINALVTIIGVVVGGIMLGLPGIFLALPIIAILKIIFDRIEDLRPWGMLMGDDTETKGEIYRRLEKMSFRKKNKGVIVTVEHPPSDTI
ncbi:MAG: AI-2E family transporter [Ferruginibacter sp.]